jgi:hypothetical protein
MAAQNKILQYNLGKRVFELKEQGCPQDEIAAVLTRELQEGRGIDDTISQSTVQRFLKKTSDEESGEARTYVQKYTNASVPWDLEIIEEVQSFLLNIKRNLKEDPEDDTKLIPADIELRNRVYAATNLARVTFDKLKNLGALKPPGGASETDETDGDTNNGKPAVSTGSNIRSIANRFGVGVGKRSVGTTS